MEKLQLLFREMTVFYKGQPKWIQHFTKVHSLARQIALGENMPARQLYILEAAALVHDIGIRIADEKFGRHEGNLQEVEGPPVAKEMLERLGFEEDIVARVCFLVGNHHTYHTMTEADHQILVEADFLVNLFEKDSDAAAISAAYKNIFRTETGKWYCQTMFGMDKFVFN